MMSLQRLRTATNLVIFCALSIPAAFAQRVAFNAEGTDFKMYDDSRALIIGMSKYKNKVAWSTLDTVPMEVARVREALLKQNFLDKNIKVLHDLDGAELRKAIREFTVQKVERDTRMFLYYAGHGWTDGQFTGYLVPINSPAESEESFRQNLVSMADINNWSLESKAKHMLFVFDSCFSGAIFLTRSNVKPNPLFLNDADQPVRQFLTSGSATDSVPGQSDFARTLIEGLGGAADVYRDGVITANELGYWIKTKITPLGKQTPQYGSSTLKEYRYGDTIFTSNAGGGAGPRTLHINRLTNSVGTRGAKAAVPVEPENAALKAFKGIEVFYYEKIGDENRVSVALDKAGVPYSKTRASRPQVEITNGIACGVDVPIEALKSLAAALIKEGVVINAIFPYSDPSIKRQRLEVLTTPRKTGPGLRNVTEQGLSLEQIGKIASCSTLHAVREPVSSTTLMSQVFTHQIGDNSSCTEKNVSRAFDLCLEKGTVVTDWVGSYQSMRNGSAVVSRHSSLPNCLVLELRYSDSGRGPLGDCKGNGWVDYKITVNGRRNAK